MPRYGPDTALLVVDVQIDFADPKGSLYVRGGEDVVPAANAEVAKAIEAGSFVFYTQDWHPPETPHFQKDGGIWPVHCVRDTWGAELHPALEVKGPVVRKGTGGEDGYSGFSVRHPVTGEEAETPLKTLLLEAGVTQVVIAGLATDYCVKETALDALDAGYETTVLSHAIAAVDLEEGDGMRALDSVRAAGGAVE